jgi:hypothetical protein
LIFVRDGWILAVVPASSSTVELLERLARLEHVLAERDARIEVLTRRVAELETLLRKNSPVEPQYREAVCP